jgi:hypothetical protein
MSEGEKLSEWVVACGEGWRSRGRGGKLGQQCGGLGLMSAWRGQSSCPNKGSLHGPTWLQGEPSSTVQWGKLPTIFQGADERFPWLRQTTSSLFILLGWSPISVAYLMMQSMYLGLVERMVVLCSWMWCFAMADLSGVKCMARLPTVDLAAFTRGAPVFPRPATAPLQGHRKLLFLSPVGLLMRANGC